MDLVRMDVDDLEYTVQRPSSQAMLGGSSSVAVSTHYWRGDRKTVVTLHKLSVCYYLQVFQTVDIMKWEEHHA